MKLKQLKEKFYKIISKLLNKTIVLHNKDGTTLIILPNGSTILSLKGGGTVRSTPRIYFDEGYDDNRNSNTKDVPLPNYDSPKPPTKQR